MPKNIKGGKGHKKGKNSNEDELKKFDPAPLCDEEEGTEYAVITKKLGYGQVYASLNSNGREVLAHIRGSFKSKKFKRTRLRFTVGSIILIAHRMWDTKVRNGFYKDNPVEEGGKHEQVDVIHLYSEHQKRELIKKNQIKPFMYKPYDEAEAQDEDEEETGFEFGDVEEQVPVDENGEIAFDEI